MKARNCLTLTFLLLAMAVTLIGCSGASANAPQIGEEDPATSVAAQTSIVDTGAIISEAEAKIIALTDAGLTEADVTFVRSYLEYDDGQQHYDVEFFGGNVEYDYEIDAMTGTILSSDNDAEYYDPNQTAQGSASGAAVANSSSFIGEAKARSIALKDAGLKAAEVTFVRVYLDNDDRQPEYNVEFYKGNLEYDYEIDAVTGKILSIDRDAEYYSPPQAASGADIGEAKAKQVALSHAGYTEKKVQLLRVERDYDNGRLEYEVEFHVNHIEYTYEIDAADGTVLNYKTERD